MRTIKFRAWDKKNNKIYIPDYLNAKGEILENTVEQPESMDMEDNILMQYTGVKDKNGKEIYEGDIIHVLNKEKWRNEVDHHATNHVVRWDEESAIFLFASYLPATWGGHESFEVIGNIYENNELLSK